MSQSGQRQHQRALCTALLGTAALAVVMSASPALASGSDAAVQTAPSAAEQAPVSQATPQSAQPSGGTTAAPSTQVTQAQTIVVTGSLIRRSNTETASPVTVLSADTIAKEGITNISDAVRSVSADNSGTIPNAFSNGFAAGASGASLRGLTAADTLVLIDGLRTAAYPVADDGVRSFVDLNTIPIGAVDRVEVDKNGASSIYGSDAVAGVVNIIMKQSFQGFQADASYVWAEEGGGTEVRANALMGYGDLGTQGWNAYLDLEYQNDGKIAAGQRNFPYNTTDLSSIGGNNLIGGQPGLNSGSIYGSVAPAGGGLYQPLRACGRGSTPTTDAGGSYCAQNFVPYYDDQPAQQRWGIYGRFTKQLDPNNQAFVDVYYYENKLNTYAPPQQIETSVPINTNAITLPALLTNGQLNPNNPFAAQGQAALINYAFGDIPFSSTYDDHVIRGTFGVKGDLFGFNYETDVTIAHNSLNTVNRGYINYDQLIGDINDGSYSFINPASNSAATLAALSPALAKVSTSDLDSFDFHATRNLFQLPGGPLAFAFGGQVRYEAISDPGLNSVNIDGTATPATVLALGLAETQGHRYVGAAFFQVDAPVLKGLDLDVSGRYDHYSDFGGNFVPQVELTYEPFLNLDFAPVRHTKFRATYGQGFRAPSFSQNGSSESEGFITYTPPQAFAAAHNNDAYVQPYSQAEFSTANPAIKPETSETYTFGVVLDPYRFLNMSIDYYHIRQNGIIAQSDPSAVLNAYYAGTALPAGSSVTLDNPDPNAPNAPRRVTVVESPFVNANSLTTDGLDVDFRANFNLPFGVKYTSDFNATDIFGYEYTQGANTYNYVGTQAPFILSSGAGTPKYRANWLNSFVYDKLTVSGTLNFVSGFKETGIDATGSSDVATACLYSDAAGDPFPRSCHVKSFWDIDLTSSYKLTSRLTLYFDVLNLTNKSAPLDPADYAGAGANYNPTYAQEGIVGRFFRAGLNFKY
jgi:iron complex outermembrane recepter protein